MDSDENAQEESWVDAIIPPDFNLGEKIYYLIAQTNACLLPFSLLYAAFGDNPKAGAVAAVNAVLTYGSLFKLKKSYNNRNGRDAMTVDCRPGISLAGRNYRAPDISNLLNSED